MSPTADPYDHLRPRKASLSDGVYRVVGTDDETVTLLRVGDADGQRVHTGDVSRVDRDALDGFDPAENPDGDRPLAATVAGAVESTYWSLRTFLVTLAGRPLPTVVALVPFVAGLVGGPLVPGGDTVEGLLILGGSLALAAVGGGRV